MTKPHKYTDEQIEFLEINCKGIQYKKLARMFNERFKTNLTRNAIAVKCQRLGFKNGVDKTFQKGNKLWNKGMTGYMGPNKTSFKKGNIPESWVPVGSETHRTDGYLKRFLGEPILTFHPYEYGDPYTKNTAIWGDFNVPKKTPVKPRQFEHPTTKGARDFVSCVEHFKDLKDIPEGYLEKTGYSKRAVMRSMTPQGFANAFYKANK